jgi:serine protease Do
MRRLRHGRRPLLGLLLVPCLWTAGPAAAQSLRDLFRKVVPSVVVIRAKGRDVAVGGATRYGEIGSGVLISRDGQIMTAAHVVHAVDEVTVEFIGGDKIPARIVASDPGADLAMIQLERVPASAMISPLGNSDQVAVGDQVMIVGAPYGLSHSMSAGYISARWGPGEVYQAIPRAEFFQTDAVINTGNSGGPMFNMNGEVIGIVSHNISKSGGSEGLGFVVTSNSARRLLLERKTFWTGVEGQMLSGELAEVFNLPQPAGYLVKIVAKGSAFDNAGIRGGNATATIGGEQLVVGGDILLAVEGIQVGPPQSLGRILKHLASLPSGAPFKASVLRAGAVIELTGRIP